MQEQTHSLDNRIHTVLFYAHIVVCAVVISISAFLLLKAESADAAAFTRSLEMGMSGNDVSALQTYLAMDPSIYPEGLVTGYFGSLTQAAVMRFQASRSIDQAGRVGPITRAALNAIPAVAALPMDGALGTGGSDDVSAPIMSTSTVVAATNTAVISWNTNEPAWHRVMYGTIWPFLYATAAKASDVAFDANGSVLLSNLLPNTLYYYVRESEDVAGNVMWDTAASFRTATNTP